MLTSPPLKQKVAPNMEATFKYINLKGIAYASALPLPNGAMVRDPCSLGSWRSSYQTLSRSVLHCLAKLQGDAMRAQEQ